MNDLYNRTYNRSNLFNRRRTCLEWRARQGNIGVLPAHLRRFFHLRKHDNAARNQFRINADRRGIADRDTNPNSLRYLQKQPQPINRKPKNHRRNRL